MSDKGFLIAGAVNGALAVVLGAFGAHGLEDRIASDLLVVYHTAVEYHTSHALALLAVGLASRLLPDSAGLLRWSGWLFLTGIVLFSGSLYTLSITDIRGLGAITPFGGVAFIAGWIVLAVAAWRG